MKYFGRVECSLGKTRLNISLIWILFGFSSSRILYHWAQTESMSHPPGGSTILGRGLRALIASKKEADLYSAQCWRVIHQIWGAKGKVGGPKS